MGGYQIVVVGTDGSESSLHAVDRAGEIAADSNATLIIATGYFPHRDESHAEDVLREEAYKVHDLLMVGNLGLNARSAILGRVFSVPGSVSSRAKSDVLIVHTTD